MYAWDFAPVVANAGLLAQGLVNTLKSRQAGKFRPGDKVRHASFGDGIVVKSTDHGSTWTTSPLDAYYHPDAPSGSAEAKSIAIDGTGKIYVATAYGVSVSGDMGESWTALTPFAGSNRRVSSGMRTVRTSSASTRAIAI